MTAGQEDNGFLLIDKPAGITSFDVIHRLRRLSGIRRIGHTGTLDPFATGLLICALGKFTRLCAYLESEDKSYSATVQLGRQTDTGDTEGRVVADGQPVPENIDETGLATAVLGLSELPVPIYSAVKVNGRRAYDYARSGIELQLAKRPVTVSEFSVESYSSPLLSYSCRVSKGTYIRSLSEFIASQLGTVGHTVALRRTAIGAIRVEASHALGDLAETDVRSLFHPAAVLFAGYTSFTADAEQLAVLRNGQSLPADGSDEKTVMIYDARHQLAGVGRRDQGILSPVINLA